MTELSSELTILLWAVALTFIQLIISILGATQQLGLSALAGNRENMVPTSGWVGRAQNPCKYAGKLGAFRNTRDRGKVIGVSNDLTILGSRLFIWGRLAYAVIYILGIPWLRTAVFLISILGMILIFLQLV